MPVLDTEQLLFGIKNSLHVAPHEISQSMIDRYIERVRNKDVVASTDAPETLALLSMIKSHLFFIHPRHIKALSDCEIYVIPFPLCIAYSERKRGQNRIVISSGQLDLISANIGLMFFDRSIPEELDKIQPFDHIPNLSVKSATTIFLFFLIYRFYQHGEDLPDCRSLLKDQLKETVKNLIKGAAIYILLHELGHLELGHIEADEIRPMGVNLLIEQDLSIYQQQEFEADQFALDSFNPEYREVCMAWMNLALEFFSQMESMSSYREQYHPITLNRIYHAHTSTQSVLGIQDKDEMEKHFQKQSGRFQSIEQHNMRMQSIQRLPFLNSVSRATLIETLEKLATFHELANIDLMSAVNGKAPDWHTYTGITA